MEYFFLRDTENLLSVKEVMFLHDKAPCFKALLTGAASKQWYQFLVFK